MCILGRVRRILGSSRNTNHRETTREKGREQKNGPVAFPGGRFTWAQRNWIGYEKETCPIVQTFRRLDSLFWEVIRTHVLPDHKNLLYVFATLVLRSNWTKHVLSKVLMWAVSLSRFYFFINHIEGLNNISADILSRWFKGHRTSTARVNRVAALFKDIKQ